MQQAPLGAGILVPDELNETLGAKKGGSIATDDGLLKVGGIYDYPSDGRRPGLGYAALFPSSNQSLYDECWVDAWPQIENIRLLLLATLSPSAALDGNAERPVISSLNPSMGAVFNGGASFGDRISQYASMAMLGIGVCLGAFSVWSRRLHFSSARHVGVRGRDIVMIAVLEGLLWSLTATLFCFAIIIFLSTQLDRSDAIPLLLFEFSTPLSGLFGVVLGITVCSLFIREKALFRFFKSR